MGLETVDRIEGMSNRCRIPSYFIFLKTKNTNSINFVSAGSKAESVVQTTPIRCRFDANKLYARFRCPHRCIAL